MSSNSNHQYLGKKSIAIVGSGLVGSLLAIYLRGHGLQVFLFESRPDPRKAADRGRSINLVLTSRGIDALCGVSDELAARVMKITTPVFGRTLHSVNSELAYQPYGPDATYCNFSVSRWELNTLLIDAAEKAGTHVFFNHPLAHIDIPTATLYFYLQDPSTTQLYQKSVTADHVFAADGGGSRARQALKGLLRDAMTDQAAPLGYGYKEMTIPLLPNGSPACDTDSLHIWPRGSHFMMALPNHDGSQTVTLYLPEREGDLSFKSLDSPDKVRRYFEQYYPDAIPIMPQFIQEFTQNPTGFLGTVFAGPWIFGDKFALIGDAAHAVTPFFGQGCNCGFEDVALFDKLFVESQQSHKDMTWVFSEYYRLRKPNADAIARMALENFTEMMSKTADPKFLLQKEVEIRLAQKFPTYVSRYALVTHSLIPYDLCKQIGQIQQQILAELTQNITSVDQFDEKKAAQLIESLLVPFLLKHQITPSQYHFTSKFYSNILKNKL